MIFKCSSALFFLSVSCALFLTSCNSSKESASDKALSSIVGVYDVSRDHGQDGIDEWYLEIDSEGYISDYDYQGDSFDNSSNCYSISQNWGQFIYLSGNEFRYVYFSDVEMNSNVIITVVDGGGISIVNKKYSDSNETLGKKTSLVKSDFLAAECTTGFSDARVNREVLEKHKNRWSVLIM